MKKETIKKVVKKITKPRKKWVNSNKPTQDGITFDSDMEMYMYTLLKQNNISFEYIGNQRAKYTLLEESKYPTGCYERLRKSSPEMKDTRKILSINYTPDFVGENEEWFLEVKGRKLGDFSMRWKLFKIRMMRRDRIPLLFMPVKKEDCQQVINILKDLGYAK